MPWNYEIDGERRLVISTAWDILTGVDVLEHRRQLRSDTRFSRDFLQLLDFTRVTAMNIDAETVRELTRENLFSRKSRRAFVAPTPIAFGMSRMFISIRQLSGRTEQMAVFKERDQAMQWLFKA
jgi:hypothetical protein